jgi:hypothetical protein
MGKLLSIVCLTLALAGGRTAFAKPRGTAGGATDFTSAREIRTAGKALTALGVILHVASIPLVVLAALHTDDASSGDVAFVAAGAATTAASAIAVGTGVGLWGAADRFERAEDRLVFSPAGVRIRF